MGLAFHTVAAWGSLLFLILVFHIEIVFCDFLGHVWHAAVSDFQGVSIEYFVKGVERGEAGVH